MKDKPYRALLGSIMWGQAATIPDLSFAVSVLTRFQNNPGPAHWKALVGVAQYVRGTIDYTITYEGPRDGETVGDGMGLEPYGYVDADYTGDVDGWRSTSGYVFMIAGGPVSWSLKLQSVVAQSTTESEYIALAQGSKQAMWMKEIRIPIKRPIMLRDDNLRSISLTENTKKLALVKHINVKYHLIRDLVKKKQVRVLAIRSTKNLADLFTKALPRAAHDHIVTALGLKKRCRMDPGEC